MSKSSWINFNYFKFKYKRAVESMQEEGPLPSQVWGSQGLWERLCVPLAEQEVASPASMGRWKQGSPQIGWVQSHTGQSQVLVQTSV